MRSSSWRDGVEPRPESLLGKPVVTPAGAMVGKVVDVGLFNYRQPKFLLVEPPKGPLLRIELGQVEDAGAPTLRLSVPGQQGGLPT